MNGWCKKESGYIYLVKTGFTKKGLVGYKIGRSTDVNSRIKALAKKDSRSRVKYPRTETKPTIEVKGKGLSKGMGWWMTDLKLISTVHSDDHRNVETAIHQVLFGNNHQVRGLKELFWFDKNQDVESAFLNCSDSHDLLLRLANNCASIGFWSQGKLRDIKLGERRHEYNLLVLDRKEYLKGVRGTNPDDLMTSSLWWC